MRISALVIPPAWTDVWIAPSANGHIQATGRDARGRKQYCYHERWSRCRGEAKFSSLTVFADALPGLRTQVNADFAVTTCRAKKWSRRSSGCSIIL